ncbi:MAG: hypothetical protein UV05_C0016G0004 [candidate division CPR1 bacterium GW2011_GWA2_42_17]|uniref:Uncharacterized protein n=1 Tax=candidate division CPR1 bacterium GW2011_GWA2_42_17 TaxID=1618341 RepID=A0A0G1BC59_9BACT|nr:MAG: hypothetical protein UV05_C0016G0004 [candidate division CPR1 bacterium GW2011_GWA2_42_17]
MLFSTLLFSLTPLVHINFAPRLLSCARATLLILCILTLSIAFFNSIIKNTRLHAFVRNLALVVYALLLFFFILEGVFMFIPQSHRYAMSLASKRWMDYYWKPINQFGFRGRDIALDDLARKKRIFFLGDSFTTGYGINNIKDRFSDILESKLSKNYCLLNLGVNGADTRSELALYYKFPIKPHLLIYQYYGNDIDNVAFTTGKSFNGNVPYKDVPGILKPLVQNSYLLDFIYWQLPHGNSDEFVQFLVDTFQDPEILSAHLYDIKRILLLSQERSIPVVVVLFPFLTDPQKSLFYTTLLKNFFDSQKIPVVNVDELIQDIPLEQRVVNKTDLHPSALVHKRVAEELYKTLVRLNYITE